MAWWMFLLLALAGAVLALVLIASRKPDTFRIERRIVLDAGPEAIFPYLDSLESWQLWSPWARKDPAMRTTYGPSRAGTGASMGWDGNGKVGKGNMSIVESRPHEAVVYRLEFEKPFRATNRARFTLKPVDGGTELVWTMEGPAPLVSKIMDLLMNMDRMVGRDFEAGLANLRALVER
ncbi:MAG: SRPBCC family protein [Beijerinckiaceae bacterium]|nr:SRPBCC family protein [Beijerinckiaceae bacterium]MCZ8298937.1 SRPBCC family protein [Beijerinckiaceae bacterium]